MLSEVLGLIKEGVGIGHLGQILHTLEDLVNLCGQNYLKDDNARNAMIDSLVQILQQHKSKQ